ncbi:MAG: pyrroline-5-carboxylate reductase [Lachnospiraceae bacterium]|jgi:pyrroline-5-carboxylate reductase|nr:pyrroline-5-carboxylate reductase [Lachnospiraceae bacterium]
MKITFIGLGNMATAMLGGILASGIAAKEDIIGADKSAEASERARARFGINIAANNKTAVAAADLVVLAIKPQTAAEALAEIKGHLAPQAIVLSIMAGKTIEWMARQLTAPVNQPGSAAPADTPPPPHQPADMPRHTPKIVRTMPNTPALVGAGVTGASRNAEVSYAEMKMCLELLGSFSKAEEVPETLMDAVVGVSGSGPAYVFLFIDALAEAAVAAGMPREQAVRFAAGTVLGGARMVLETDKTPAELTEMVCSPGGTTIEAVKVFAEKGFRDLVIAAATAAMEKSKRLAGE